MPYYSYGDFLANNIYCVLLIPVLLLSLIIVDLAPVLWLILLTGALMVLTISHSVRERSPAEGSRLAWWLVLPTLIHGKLLPNYIGKQWIPLFLAIWSRK